MNELELDIFQIITRVVGLQDDGVSKETSIRGLGITSMKIVEMILLIEKKYGIELPDDATYTIDTASQLVDCVRQLINEKNAQPVEA
ncbi:acyl carrier protein [Pseudomonas entomophila]|uniref:acyl carrier protein n=1 Tax=Pseudomonas entomophila TaxID=312306 RepID=UPI002406C347|nr:acyl carrier protein [Pseudomonas entomophila]MDF9616399.1 acyl carrier protein [Pseudomonas entomophila]